MTTNTPPTSPGSKSKKSKKAVVVAEDFVAVAAAADTHNDSRMIRYAGFEGEGALAKPLLIDDLGLIPSDLLDSTHLALNRAGKSSASELLALEGCTDRLELFARGTATHPWPYKYAVAVIPADSADPVRVWDAHVMLSERRVKRLKAVEESDAARLGATAADSAATAAIDYKTAQNLLGEAFGTRKRKQAIVSLEKNKVRADSLGQPASEFISQTLEESSSSSSGSSDISAASVSTASSLLPVYNKDTLVVSEIYPIKGVIPQECYKALPVEDFVHVSVRTGKDELDALQARYGIKDFWFNRILAAPRDDGNHTLRLLLFGHFLTSFRQLKEAALNGPDGSISALQSNLLECPEPVALDLLSRFADRVAPASTAASDSAAFLGKCKHKLPNTLRDKAILYILIVLLHTDNYRVNATSVAELLAITPTKLVSFFRALGCTIDRPGRGEELNVNINNRLVPVKFARLTAPLTFPLPPKRQSKK